ncbi:hypothetical protein V6N13_123226 [Hibiscus sabdariffa]
MKGLGEAAYVLGVKIYRYRSRRLLGLSQSTYIDKVLKRFSMEESKKGFLPMRHGISLSKQMCPSTPQERERMSQIPYASAIRSIMYAMICTRPDLSYALSMTSRYQANPGEGHWIAVKNILKYLRRTKDVFLVYGGEEELGPTCLSRGAIVPPIPQNNQQQPVRTVRDHLAEDLEGLNPTVTIPEFEAEHFELKPIMFNMLNTLGQFGGSPAENARQHLKSFLEICNSFKIQGVSNDVLQLKLFPYSLRDKAKAWLNDLPPGSLQSWTELCRSFLAKFSYTNMTDHLRNHITSFRQVDDEAMHEEWERYRDLFRRCPIHGLPEWTQISALTNMVKNMQRKSNTHEVKALDAFCELCGNNHDASECGQAPESSCYVGNYNKNTKTPVVIDTPATTDIPAEEDEDHRDPIDTKEAGPIAEASQPEPIIPEKLEEIRPPSPFLQRLEKQKQGYQFKKFFDILKQVQTNLPLVEALQQIPNYAKFLKDMVSMKRRIGEFETAAVTKTCLALKHNKVPAKKTDPGSFTIECFIGNNYSNKALCDPGAIINFMPKSVFQKLGIGEAKPITVMMQLADHSFVQPKGKIEDILVRIDNFIFLTGFLILDYEADENTPIILGRPFLATGQVLLDFGNVELILRVDDQ